MKLCVEDVVGSGRGYGRGRGVGGFNRDSGINENSFGNWESDGGKAFERHGGGGCFRGGRRGGFTNGDRPRHRSYERRSGTAVGMNSNVRDQAVGTGEAMLMKLLGRLKKQ